MGSQDLNAFSRDGKRTFRYGTNRMVEISLQHELDDVAKKSVDEIFVKKEFENQKPMDIEEYTARKLRPAFISRRQHKKMKLEPVFHEDLIKHEPKQPQFMLMPNIPPYNPLDKFGMFKEFSYDKIRSYPYARENTVTTEEMQKARVTSLGVLPVRRSNEVSSLKVIIEGKPVAHSRDVAIDETAEANLAHSESPGTPDELTEQHQLENDSSKLDSTKKKPAIVKSEGTSVQVSLTARPPKQPPKSTLKRKHRVIQSMSAKSIASSLKSGEIVLPDETVYCQYDQAIADINDDDDDDDVYLENIQTAVGAQTQKEQKVQLLTEEGRGSGALSEAAKSVKDLLEEAKRIASPGAESVLKLKKKESKKEIKKVKAEKSKGKKVEEGKDVVIRSERTVDEIIASLKSQSRTGLQLEADRKIQEIMDRVMSRSSAGDEVIHERPERNEPVSQQTIHEEDEDKADELDRKEAERYLEERMGVTSIAVPPAPPSTAQRPPEVEPLIGLAEPESDEEDTVEIIDIQQAWEDLQLPNATLEDMVSVSGVSAPLEDRNLPFPGLKTPVASVYTNSVSFLSAWKPRSEKRKHENDGGHEDIKRPSKNVHHFCTATTEYQLPQQFWHVGRKYHTPGRFQFAMPDQQYRFGSQGPSSMENSSMGMNAQFGSKESHDTEQRRISAAAHRVLQMVVEEVNTDNSLEAWQHRAEEVFDQPQMMTKGVTMPIKSDESRLYWTPAPPKLDVAPAKVKEILFHEYSRPTAGVKSQEMQDVMEESSSSEEDEEEIDFAEHDREHLEQLERTLTRHYNSMENLTELTKAFKQREQDIKEGKLFPYEERILTEQEKEKIEKSLSSQSGLDHKETNFPKGNVAVDTVLYPTFVPWRRSVSAPDLNDEDDDTLLVSQDYNTAMEEIQRQKLNVREWKAQQKLLQRQQQLEEIVVQQEDTIEQLQRVDEQEYQPDISKIHSLAKMDEPTPAELALAAGRAYVTLPKKKKKKKKPIANMARLDDIENFLHKAPRHLSRCESMIKIPKPVEKELRVSQHVRQGPRRSLPDILNFVEYGKKKRLRSDEDPREWVRDIWNKWFDEVFPPTPSESDYEDEEELTEEQIADREDEDKKKKRKDSLCSLVPEGMEYIEPMTESDDALEIHQIIMEEIEKLTEEMNSSRKPKAFDFCRRGALYRKISYLKAAEDDLTRAVQLEPLLLDAYWHRHLLYVLQDRKKEALDDLTFILKHTKTHAGAYRSMAEIYKRQDDITMAIVNYTQAIKLNPRDHEAYYARAECYEKRGDMLLALEDYSACTKILPTKTDAILKHGLYYFENKSWFNAINDFTELLKADPLNASAHVYRGRAYAAMGQWSPAVEDLSAAIHLDPNHWQAFYHRGCILRKAHPKRALSDFSVSLIINDGDENISSYLHRGILYSAIGKPEDAIPDFDCVLKLNKNNACAHVNLGLIMMSHYHNYHRAIKRFTSAIKVDPTYVRAYVCRGEAYHKIHELKLALYDFTRAIHLNPDVHHYYMYRGQLLLEQGNLELAAFCVRHASEIGSGTAMGQHPTQQAVVHSFLKNYAMAIEVLQTATRSQPGAAMFMLLGKTQIKAKNFSDAISSFQVALNLYKPWKARDPWPIEAAEAHFLCGQCNMELKNYSQALEAFSNAIKMNPNMAEALYHRGMARMKLKMSKGIQDFNRALAINPAIFQAFLSRACVYSMKGNYTKAILNCNEAIKLQSKSVRAYLYRGALKFHIKAYDLAILDLTKAASIDSTCALAYFNRAVCHQENREYQKALTDYGIVLLLGDSLKLKVLINRGLLYFEKKDYLNALYDFKLSAQMSPHDHKILHTLGLCYHKLGQLQEAVATFTSCVESQPFFIDGILSRGNVYMDYGQETGLKKAMHDYERVLRLDPLNLPARVNLAYSLQVSGHFMQAWRQFTCAIDIKPNYKPALEGRSIINLQMSDTFASFHDINAAIRVSPTAELLTNRGVIHQFMCDHVNAMQDYQAALHLDPTYSLAYFNAANVYFHTRHFTQALDYYTKAVQCNPNDESAFLNRAITQVMLKDAKGALSDFRTAIKLSPYSAHMYLNRGNLYASTEQYDLAEKDYTKALELQPDDPLVLKKRADVRGKLGKKYEAIQDYKEAIELQGRIQYLQTTKLQLDIT